MTLDDDDKLGRILVRMLAVSPERLEHALEAQRAGDRRDIGTLLGATPEQVKAALEVQREWRDGDVRAAALRIVDAAVEKAKG